MSTSAAKSQLEKRVDALWQLVMNGSGGVGENIGKHNERFNLYTVDVFAGNTISEQTSGDYNSIRNYNNKVNGNGYVWACDLSGHGNKIEGSGQFNALKISGHSNTVGSGNHFASDVGGYGNSVTGAITAAFIRGYEGTFTAGSYGGFFGQSITVSAGSCQLAAGYGNTISGNYGLTIGNDNTNSTDGAIVGGNYAFTGSTFLLAIGSGGFSSDPKNIFTVDKSGDVTAHAYNTSSADYAEYFEWADGNTGSEDRMGMLVTLCGKYIVPAHGDDFFGAISARASVVGNAYEDYWHGKYVTDVYGRVQYDEEGHALISPDFDPDREYIPRSQRPEWDVTGLVGRVIIRDDGSCKPGGYVSARHGVGTSCTARTAARVLERIDENHVEILIK